MEKFQRIAVNIKSFKLINNTLEKENFKNIGIYDRIF